MAIDFHCIPLGCYLTSGGGTADDEIAIVLTDQFGTVYGDQLLWLLRTTLLQLVPKQWLFVDFLTPERVTEGCGPILFNYNIRYNR